jgi:CheY-like chemotaxis protein
MAAGMDDLISKPFQTEEIFACLQRLLGARFDYAQAAPRPPASSFVAVLPAQLRALPPALQAALRQAVMELNMQKTDAAIAEIAQIDESLAAWLRHYNEAMDFETMWKLLENFSN